MERIGKFNLPADMAGRDRRLYDVFFVAMLICLTVFKWNDLRLPYFWDELGVYTQAADYQVQHSLSLAPASVPPVLSRGHPLLFTFMNALVWRVFGEQVMVAHQFCFFIAVLLLLAVYLKVSKYFNPVAGLASAAICMIQPLFLAQSGMVLPEITLALLIFMALCSYYEGRLMLFALFASLALLTKEVAVVLPVVVIFYSVVQWIVAKERPRALTPAGLFTTVIPYLIFGCFLLLQKWQNGWYFFPFHMDAVVFDIGNFIHQFERFAWFVFIQQGRCVLTSLTVVSILVLGLVKNGLFPKIASSQLTPVLRTYPLFEKKSGEMPIENWYWHLSKKFNPAVWDGGFLLLMVLFMVVFTALNSLFGVYMGRYATVVMVAFCVVAGVAITAVWKNGLYTGVVMLVLLVVGWRYQEGRGFNYDEDLGYRHQVHVLQQGVTEVLKTIKPVDKVYGNFPGYFALSFSKSGYLKGATINPKQMSDHDYNYYLLCNPPNPGFETDSSKYVVTLLKAFDDGYAHAGLYRVSKK